MVASVGLPVSLRVGAEGEPLEIGTLDVPITLRLGTSEATVSVDEEQLGDWRPELAALLRAAADEIETPTPDDEEADDAPA